MMQKSRKTYGNTSEESKQMIADETVVPFIVCLKFFASDGGSFVERTLGIISLP